MQLWDYAFDKFNAGEKFTRQELRDDLSWGKRTADDAIRDLRRVINAHGRQVNLVCKQYEQQQPWLYALSGDPDELEEFSKFLGKHLEARLVTMQALLVTRVTVTDGRSREGREARLVLKGCESYSRRSRRSAKRRSRHLVT